MAPPVPAGRPSAPLAAPAVGPPLDPPPDDELPLLAGVGAGGAIVSLTGWEIDVLAGREKRRSVATRGFAASGRRPPAGWRTRDDSEDRAKRRLPEPVATPSPYAN